MGNFRSEEYLDFIRQQSCLICSRHQADPHHWRKGTDGGTGLKPSDFFCIPLCREHHAEAHNLSDKRFAEKYDINISDELSWLISKFIRMRIATYDLNTIKQVGGDILDACRSGKDS